MKKLCIILFLIVSDIAVYGQNYNNIINYNFNGTPTNGIKIKTNLPFTPTTQMPTIIIEGYNYGTGQTIGLIITYYTYSGGSDFYDPANYYFHNAQMSSFGTYAPPVSLSAEGGKVVIFINDRPYYQRFTVSAFAQGMSEISSWFDGWTVADEALTGTKTVLIPYSTNLAGNVSLPGNGIWNSGGSVGIGTSSPAYSLDINKSTASLNLNGSGFGNSGALINLLGWAGTSKNWQMGVADIGYDGLMFTPSTVAGGSTFTTPAMIINSNGNVVIGATAAPACYKFAIAGAAVAESMTVKLQANWCDYVFKKDYLLMPLSELKAYIDKNQHLPEIPAAAEVERNGLDLGEMNKVLVKKVEELTLYLIEKDKEDKARQQEVDELKKQVETLLKASQKDKQ